MLNMFKYRAWHNELKKMLEVTKLVFTDDTSEETDNTKSEGMDIDGNLVPFTLDEVELMLGTQFCGDDEVEYFVDDYIKLTDKKTKESEIYQIVYQPTTNTEIKVTKNDAFASIPMFILINEEDEDNVIVRTLVKRSDSESSYTSKRVGNIYEGVIEDED